MSRFHFIAVAVLSLACACLHAAEPPTDFTVDSKPFASAEYADAHRLWQGIPSIERSRAGRLFVAWYSGERKEGDRGNYCLLAVSNEQGESWTAPLVVIRGRAGVRAGEPLPWLDPLGRLWLFWNGFTGAPETSGTWATVCDAPDAAEWAWTVPRFISNGIVLGKPIVTRDAAWLAPLDVRNGSPLAKRVGDHVGGVLRSTDQGATWQWQGGFTVPAELDNFDEHCLVERRDGSLWTVLRTNHGLMQSASRDGGKTWSAPEPFMSNAVTRACLLRLASGNLLLIYHDGPGRTKGDRTSYARRDLTAFLSTDDGKTWKHKLLLDPRDKVSYPDATQGPDGTIYITYDYHRYGTGCKEILFTSITEDDIFKKRLPRTPTVVSRATGYGNHIELENADEDTVREKVNKELAKPLKGS
ncbi:MAG TPA: sialidase family protein [Pirellulales bacterium]|nr:sialidase family protein [Pirellulales bacterium]